MPNLAKPTASMDIHFEKYILFALFKEYCVTNLLFVDLRYMCFLQLFRVLDETVLCVCVGVYFFLPVYTCHLQSSMVQ